MNIDPNGSTEFLNFSDALNHIRWGEKIARRRWANDIYVVVIYKKHGAPTLVKQSQIAGLISSSIHGSDLLAEDWYVLGEHQ